MGFIEKFKEYKKRVLSYQDRLTDMTEEATKNAFVMPFFAMMGYDIFNPSEFIPEFVCDLGTKKGEKIDYAIMRDGEPIMLIEVKKASMKLQKQQHSQLFRYFSVNRSRIAVLTNGIQYNIYSDIDAPNVMDNEPFFAFNLLEDDEDLYLQSLEQFTSENFDIKTILSKAIYLKYAKVVEKTILNDLENPSDDLIRYFLNQPEVKPSHRITTHTIQKYRDITRKTLKKVTGVTINKNIIAPPVKEDTLTPPVQKAVTDSSELSTPIPEEIPEPTLKVATQPLQSSTPTVNIPLNYCICCKRSGKLMQVNEEHMCAMCADTASEEQKLNAKREAGLI